MDVKRTRLASLCVDDDRVERAPGIAEGLAAHREQRAAEFHGPTCE
jgi:hypothetical protein